MTTSWNRIPRVAHAAEVTLNRRGQPLPGASHPLLAYGLGRSYGDVCLNPGGSLLHTRDLDRFIAFDPDTGRITAEAGLTLDDLLRFAVPRGWFVPVVPGTRFVTLGGAVANDVHGKNHHHAGSFGEHVRAMTLRRSAGECLEVTPDDTPDWFAATVGGLGLTGLIETVTLQLVPVRTPWMRAWSQRFDSLDEFWELDARAEREWPYTVAWIDCLNPGPRGEVGRGIYSGARHATTAPARSQYREPRRAIPLDPPVSLVNRVTLRLFNQLYYRQSVHPTARAVHHLPWLFPLDAIRHWNRIYGYKGFYQYQCVLPPHAQKDGMQALLDAVAASGQGSFLAVLKRFGDRAGPGMLSFPRPGATLALDFPERGNETEHLFRRLDHIVQEAGGALYPAKDARMSPDLFRSGFPRWEEFASFVDPEFSSGFWRRVTK
ncbi:FAD linked oxidase domain protein [Thioalkalivibrio sp. K90mix]|uniref:FAD-binding oxidoreductase n=1 Tax=unclassified Thioalkalivibrio TaxID=2621013 RepID=UPI000195A79C|nr:MULTISPECIES: FAD-binding oxidoreductase [unclassified Thioalkalivibrio]ADC71526.1 FAD linked oxidase domain protein [Thioalkalivibrio sp. K90mix]